jgi:hypothetical protein
VDYPFKLELRLTDALMMSGTFEWFLSDRKFAEWRNTTGSKMMFVTAGAGCGKSVLLKSLVDEELATSERRVTCYFFFRKGYDQQESALEALSALLHQLFCQAPHLIELALPDYNRFGEKNFSAQFATLWKILLECATAYDGEVLCVLDGLDECQAEDIRTTPGKPFYPRKELTKRLKDTYALTTPTSNNTQGRTLKFLVSARKSSGEEFLPFMSDTSMWSDVSAHQGLSDTDLKLFVNHKLPELDLDEQVKDILRDELLQVQAESRTYLWLSLILDTLSGARFRNRGEKYLLNFLREELPKSVEEAFEKVLPDPEHEEKAKLIFHIIFAARRPLTLSELSEATEVAITVNRHGEVKSDIDFQYERYFERTLATYCGSFISVASVGGKKIVGFFHQKAREFLLRIDSTTTSSSSTFKHAFAQEESNMLLRKYCISYLKYIGSKNMERNITTGSSPLVDHGSITNWLQKYINAHPFIGYTAMHWIFHLPFEAEDQKTRDQIAAEIAPICDIGSPLFRTWFLCCWCLWWPDSSLEDFFKLFVDGWTPDHIYPDVELIKEFGKLNLRGADDDEKDKWWFWTAKSGTFVFKQLLRICGGPKSEARVRVIPIYSTNFGGTSVPIRH